MGKVAMAIDNKLRAEFSPARLAVEDESSQHHGHAGWREGGDQQHHDHAAQGEFIFSVVESLKDRLIEAHVIG